VKGFQRQAKSSLDLLTVRKVHRQKGGLPRRTYQTSIRVSKKTGLSFLFFEPLLPASPA
jgi:hypothetical protein